MSPRYRVVICVRFGDGMVRTYLIDHLLSTDLSLKVRMAPPTQTYTCLQEKSIKSASAFQFIARSVFAWRLNQSIWEASTVVPHSQLLGNSNLTCHTSDVCLRRRKKK